MYGKAGHLLGKPEVHCNEQESNGLLRAVGLVQVYSEETASTIKCGAFVMY